MEGYGFRALTLAGALSGMLACLLLWCLACASQGKVGMDS